MLERREGDELPWGVVGNESVLFRAFGVDGEIVDGVDDIEAAVDTIKLGLTFIFDGDEVGVAVVVVVVAAGVAVAVVVAGGTGGAGGVGPVDVAGVGTGVIGGDGVGVKEVVAAIFDSRREVPTGGGEAGNVEVGVRNVEGVRERVGKSSSDSARSRLCPLISRNLLASSLFSSADPLFGGG